MEKEFSYGPKVPERLLKDILVKYISITSVLLGALGIFWSQNNPKTSKYAAVVQYLSFMTISQDEHIYELNMVTVQGGRFAMGGNNNNDEKPIHNVTLSSFKIAKYEITQGQWQKIMGTHQFSHKDCLNCPVESVGWDEVQTFIKRLNTLSCKNYRLPTEAEWEYAARGGTHSKKLEYAGSDDINEVAWTYDNSASNTHIVGQKKPNELGLYDMSGNVWEWCNDWYDENYYIKSPTNDPKGPKRGPHHIIRGGSWSRKPAISRVAYRNRERIGNRYIGFRLASSL
ncbi:MAG: SUMF1/EgtB/PvdO family nonheme iron enzyme [Pedobacter sp.]